MTISLILMTLMFDPGVILGGEIRCMSLLGSKWFTTNEYRDQLVMMIKSRMLQTKLRVERRNGWFCKKQPVSHYLSLETPRGPGGIILWVNHHRFISVCAGDKLVGVAAHSRGMTIAVKIGFPLSLSQEVSIQLYTFLKAVVRVGCSCWPVCMGL